MISSPSTRWISVEDCQEIWKLKVSAPLRISGDIKNISNDEIVGRVIKSFREALEAQNARKKYLGELFAGKHDLKINRPQILEELGQLGNLASQASCMYAKVLNETNLELSSDGSNPGWPLEKEEEI